MLRNGLKYVFLKITEYGINSRMMMKYFENIVFITITVLVQTFMYNIIRYKITLQLKVINIVTMSYFPTFKSKSKRTFNEYSPNVNIF